jgi:hypothetical protein
LGVEEGRMEKEGLTGNRANDVIDTSYKDICVACNSQGRVDNRLVITNNVCMVH